MTGAFTADKIWQYFVTGCRNTRRILAADTGEPAMTHSFVLLYVENPAASAAFYGRLLGREPIQSSPTFVMFALDSGVMLGLWGRHEVEPAANGGPGSSEIAFSESSAEAVRARCEAWREADVRIVHEPTQMDFGLTFVGVDPDGHRLRVFAPPA